MLINSLKVSSKPTSKWLQFIESKEFHLAPLPIAKANNIFCMGSCFARNIRKSLEALNVKCCPNYEKVAKLFNPSEIVIDDIFKGDYHMNYYTPFAMMQEIKDSVLAYQSKSEYGQSSYPRSEFFMNVKDQKMRLDRELISTGPESIVVMDPSRRLVFAKTASQLNKASSMLSILIGEGIAQSDLIILTMGLIEQFFIESTCSDRVMYFNQYPAYGGLKVNNEDLRKISIKSLSYKEVQFSLNEIYAAIRQINQDAPIVFTVSPVPLERTFRKAVNVYESNILSKSTLLCAVREFCEEYSDVFYFPSYEIASGIGLSFFDEKDKRHPRPEMVNLITKAFVQQILNA